MKKFAQEMGLILMLSFGWPLLFTVALAPAWWHVDGRIVLWVYLTVALILFAGCAAISVYDEFEQKERRRRGK